MHIWGPLEPLDNSKWR